MSTALTSRIAADYAAAAHTFATPPDARRSAALAALTAAGLPTSRDENWKYANLRALERLRFVPAAPEVAPLDRTVLPSAIPGFGRYVFIDGRFAPELSAPVGGMFTPWQGQSAGDADGAPPELGTDERFALLNEAFGTDGARIRVPAAATDARIELIFVARAAATDGASYPRLELDLEPGARLKLIERHVSAATAGSFVTSALRIGLSRGCDLTHYRLQALSARSTLFDSLNATMGEAASYRLHAISTGAQLARSTQTVRLAGEQAHLNMAVAALGDGQQVQDSYARIEHAAPRARTEQLFRGIAAGRARVAFNGKIVVAPGAVGTDTQQSLRGLLAGTDAEIDVRPQLEIYTDDVRCSHGATAGKLDDNMLFYLLSRGLEREVALRLLKWAFLADAFARIEVPQLRRQIEEHLAAVLQDRVLKELL
jgi:Fe-S cluster assembly protein SufD